MKLPADDKRLKTTDDGRPVRFGPTKPRERVTNNGTKHDATVSMFDQSGMTMMEAAKAVGMHITQISRWRAGGRFTKGRFVPTNPAKQGAIDSLMGNMMSASGHPPVCVSLSSIFHVGGPSAY